MSVPRLPRRTLVTAAGVAALALVVGCSENTTPEDPGPSSVVDTPTENSDPSAAPAPSPTLGTTASPVEETSTTADPGMTQSSESATADSAECTDLTGEQAVQRWVGQVPTHNGWPWDTNYASTDGYDPCQPLSWIVLPIEGGTSSSPYQIMLFHQGQYLGTATSEAYGFSPDVQRLDDASIQVTWRWPQEGESNAAASGRTTAQFRWDDARDKVVMTGDVPPSGR